MRSALCLAGALGLAASTALADTKLVYGDADGAGVPTIVYIADGHVRLDAPDADGRYALFDASAQTLVSVDPGAKSYSALDPDAIGRLTAQLAAERLALDDALPSVSAEQRAQVERVLGKAAIAAARPVVTRTSEKAKVGGYDCTVTRYEVVEQPGEVCIATAKALGLSPSDERTLGQLTAFADRMAAQAYPTGPPLRLAELGGLPAGWKHEGEPAQVVRRVSHDTLPTSLFSLPSGFRREPLKLPATP
jgi:hypothetical protein